MRYIFAILVLTICYSETDAQRIIAKGGLNLSTVNADFQLTKVKVGAIVSVGYEYSISEHFLLQADLGFIQKGYKYEREYFNDEFYGFRRMTLEVNYLEIPLVFKYKFNTTNVTYTILFGQSIGFAVGGKFDEYHINSTRFPPSLEIWERTLTVRFEDWPYPGDGNGGGYQVIENRFDFSLQFGGQIEFFSKIMFDIRYGLGLNGFYTIRYGETLPNGRMYDTKHRGLQVCVAVPFQLKVKEKSK